MHVFLCGKFRNIACKWCVAVLWNIHLQSKTSNSAGTTLFTLLQIM
jgi:hypothetical protein